MGHRGGKETRTERIVCQVYERRPFKIQEAKEPQQIVERILWRNKCELGRVFSIKRPEDCVPYAYSFARASGKFRRGEPC